MSNFYADLQDDLVARSARLSGPPPHRWLRSSRGRITAGVVAAIAAVGGGAGLATSATGDGEVSAAPAAVRSAVPALNGKHVPIPALVRRAFGNGNDDTVNGALARPLLAKLPDGSISWVAPAAHGACLGVPDTQLTGMAVVCATTEEINRRGLAISSYRGNPETGPGTEIGIGGHPEQPGGNSPPDGGKAAVVRADGSYVRRIR